MPKGYIIAHVTVTDPEPYKEYVRLDTPIFDRSGGKFLVRGGRSELVEGRLHERHIVIEFDSFEAAHAAYHDPDYQKVADIRRANAESSFVIVEGV